MCVSTSLFGLITSSGRSFYLMCGSTVRTKTAVHMWLSLQILRLVVLVILPHQESGLYYSVSVHCCMEQTRGEKAKSSSPYDKVLPRTGLHIKKTTGCPLCRSWDWVNLTACSGHRPRLRFLHNNDCKHEGRADMRLHQVSLEASRPWHGIHTFIHYIGSCFNRNV